MPSDSLLPLSFRRRRSPSQAASHSTPQPPSRFARAVSRAMMPINRSDAESLAQHWKELLENKEDYTESERLTALRVAAPSLAARWVDCFLPQRRGESGEEWERRVRRGVEEEKRRNREAREWIEGLLTTRSGGGAYERHNAEMDLYLSDKMLKYLRHRARWAFPPSSHIPLDRNAFPNNAPAWLDGQGGGAERGRADKGKRRAE
ncbi:hypothetical protein JCM6882_000590 [Rhodosporidiobolus microsporus]